MLLLRTELVNCETALLASRLCGVFVCVCVVCENKSHYFLNYFKLGLMLSEVESKPVDILENQEKQPRRGYTFLGFFCV